MQHIFIIVKSLSLYLTTVYASLIRLCELAKGDLLSAMVFYRHQLVGFTFLENENSYSIECLSEAESHIIRD